MSDQNKVELYARGSRFERGGPGLLDNRVVDVSDSYLKTQYSILTSESLARRVIDQLHLDAVPEFNSPKWWSFRRTVGAPPKQTMAIGPALPLRNRDVYQRVLERFQDRLTIEPV